MAPSNECFDVKKWFFFQKLLFVHIFSWGNVLVKKIAANSFSHCNQAVGLYTYSEMEWTASWNLENEISNKF